MNHSEENTLDIYKARRIPDEYKPFPVGMLPDPIGRYVTETAKALGCDPAYIAVPMLSILASAIGNSRCIKLKESWHEPAVLWTAVVGESGSMKTPAIRFAMKPLVKMQAKAFMEYDKKLEDYNERKKEYDQQLRAKKSGPLPDEPKEPVAMRYYCNDATIEAIAAILNDAPRGILQSCDELSGWIKSFNSYKGGKGSDEARWLEMYQAGTLLIDRKSGVPKTIRIPNASVSICGGIQPDILRRVLSREYYENGLVARLLLAMPPRKAKCWTEADIDSSLAVEVEELFDGLLKMQMDSDGYGGFKAKAIPLIPTAQDSWIVFYNEHGIEQKGMTGDLAAVWSKLEAIAARITLVVHCIRVAANDQTLVDDDFIDDDSIYAGVMLAKWFGAEIRRVYVVLEEGEPERQQRQLYELVLKKDGRITPRELMRSSRQFGESSEEAEKALQGLVNLGWGVWENPPPGDSGGRPSKILVLKNSSDDKTP
jgi:hypothetical protein